MKILSTLLHIETQTDIELINVTEPVQQQVDQSGVKQGQALVFSCHTTTALVVNEDEERLLTENIILRDELTVHNGLTIRQAVFKVLG